MPWGERPGDLLDVGLSQTFDTKQRERVKPRKRRCACVRPCADDVSVLCTEKELFFLPPLPTSRTDLQYPRVNTAVPLPGNASLVIDSSLWSVGPNQVATRSADGRGGRCQVSVQQDESAVAWTPKACPEGKSHVQCSANQEINAGSVLLTRRQTLFRFPQISHYHLPSVLGTPSGSHRTFCHLALSSWAPPVCARFLPFPCLS